MEIKRDMPLLIRQVIDENKTLIEDMNIAQLSEGKTSNDEYLPDYSPVSVEVYGKPPGPIRLYDQGDFYRGITAETDETKLDIVGKDSKTNKLKNDFGEDILGLTDDHARDLTENILQPGLMQKIKERLLQ